MPGTSLPRLLIACEGMQSAVALMRVLQFRELFEARYATEIVFRVPPWLVRGHGPKWAWFPRQIIRGPVYHRLIAARERGIVRRARRADLVYVVGVPSLTMYQRLRETTTAPIVMDMIDGLWLPYHRQFGWESLEEMYGCCDAVICENRYTAEFAGRHHPHVSIVPNAPQLEAFDRQRDKPRAKRRETVLGWVGSHDTAGALYRIWEPLERLFAGHSDLHLRVLGALPERLPAFEKVRASVVPRYDQQTMVREILEMDIGLCPLFHVEDALTRGSSKTRIYMCGEAAAAVERVGENESLVTHGVNGMLAETGEEWFESLSRLVQDPPFRRQLAGNALELMRREYSAERCFARLSAALDECQRRRAAGGDLQSG